VGDKLKAVFNLAMAEFVDHPFLSIARFIFTDDKPNKNNQGVSVDEFDAIAESAIGLPVKMEFLRDSSEADVGGHIGSIPIGVIRSMEKAKLEDGTNQLIAEVCLWADEYPVEVKYLKEKFSEGKAPGVSWELAYKDSVIDKGVKWLKGVITKAATFVKTPAYGTRTAILAMASMEPDEITRSVIALADQLKKDQEEIKPEVEAPKVVAPTNKGGKEMSEELENLQKTITEKDTLLNEKISLLNEKDSVIAEKETKISELGTEVATLSTENQTLKEKNAALEQAVLVDARIRKFTEAGLKIEADQMDKKRAFFASLTDEQWDEYLSDRVSDIVENPLAVATAAFGRTSIPRISVGDTKLNTDNIKEQLKGLARA
jgi:hypothetical protein